MNGFIHKQISRNMKDPTICLSSLFETKSIKITVIKWISDGLPAPLYQFNFITRILIKKIFN
jgi:hypothetical protein